MVTASDIQERIDEAQATYEAAESAFTEDPNAVTELDLEIAWHERKFVMSETEVYEQW